MPTVSFSQDVMPFLKQFQGPMMWRFDLTNYDQMKTNANLVWQMIKKGDDGSAPAMPPPPFPPLSDQQLATYKAWMDGGCLP